MLIPVLLFGDLLQVIYIHLSNQYHWILVKKILSEVGIL